MKSAPPAVVHIEDDVFWAGAVARWVGDCSEVRYAGFAMNGRDGIELCREKQLAIVLLDLILPDIDGFNVVDQLQALKLPPWILLLTCRTDDAVLFRIGTSPVAGLIWKSNRTGEHLRSAFSAVIAGKDCFPPEVDDAVHRFRSSPDAFSKIFSDREIFLLDDFADGLSDKAIAAKRNLNQETVHSHREHIMAKLGLHRTPDLILWAKDKGFGSHLAKTPRPGSSQPF